MFGNRGDRPRQSFGQRATGAILTGINPLIGTLYRGYTNNLNSANAALSRAGTATGGFNMFGGGSDVGQTPNEALAQGMQQYSQQSPNAPTDGMMPGAAGGVMQQQSPNSQQQIANLPAAMQTWIRNNGLPQTPDDIRRATNAMYLDQSSNMAASNYGQDIGFVAPQARAPRER